MLSRAEQIGSLKRPDVLLKKRNDFKLGKCTAKELRACEDECIAAIVRVQLELGFPVVTDGEFRRRVVVRRPRGVLADRSTETSSMMAYSISYRA